MSPKWFINVLSAFLISIQTILRTLTIVNLLRLPSGDIWKPGSHRAKHSHHIPNSQHDQNEDFLAICPVLHIHSFTHFATDGAALHMFACDFIAVYTLTIINFAEPENQIPRHTGLVKIHPHTFVSQKRSAPPLNAGDTCLTLCLTLVPKVHIFKANSHRTHWINLQ